MKKIRITKRTLEQFIKATRKYYKNDSEDKDECIRYSAVSTALIESLFPNDWHSWEHLLIGLSLLENVTINNICNILEMFGVEVLEDVNEEITE